LISWLLLFYWRQRLCGFLHWRQRHWHFLHFLLGLWNLNRVVNIAQFHDMLLGCFRIHCLFWWWLVSGFIELYQRNRIRPKILNQSFVSNFKLFNHLFSLSFNHLFHLCLFYRWHNELFLVLALWVFLFLKTKLNPRSFRIRFSFLYLLVLFGVLLFMQRFLSFRRWSLSNLFNPNLLLQPFLLKGLWFFQSLVNIKRNLLYLLSLLLPLFGSLFFCQTVWNRSFNF